MTNDDVVNRFIDQSGRDAKTKTLRYDAASGVLYSYGEHFPVGKWHTDSRGPYLLLTRANSSPSTGRHIAKVRLALARVEVEHYWVLNHLLRDFTHHNGRACNSWDRPADTDDTPEAHHLVNAGYLVHCLAAAVEQCVRWGYWADSADLRQRLESLAKEHAAASNYIRRFIPNPPASLSLPQRNPTALLQWKFPERPDRGNVARAWDLLTNPQQETATA